MLGKRRLLTTCLMLLIGGIVLAQTPISSLPFEIDQPGSYYLIQDLSGVKGITVNTDNVQIDLKGFALEGQPGSGDGILMAENLTGISIKNGEIRSWGKNGINARSISESLIRDVRLLDNTENGVFVGSQNEVSGVDASYNRKGGIIAGDNTRVYSSTASHNGTVGIFNYSAMVLAYAADRTTNATYENELNTAESCGEIAYELESVN